MRYRKRISLGKGLRLNLSKTGASMSGGIPGLSLNAGRSGTYINTGIPGTGLYDRKRISRGSQKVRGAGLASKKAQSGAPQIPITISLDDSGRTVFSFESGEPVQESSLLRRLRRDRGVKQKIKQLYSATLNDFEREISAWTGFHREAPDIPDREHWLTQSQNMIPRHCDPLFYSEKQPTTMDARVDLEAEARRTIGGPLRVLAPWVIKQRRHAWVVERLMAETARRQAKYERDKSRHDAREAERCERLNREYEREFLLRAQRITAELNGDAHVIEEDAEQLLASLALPGDCAVDFEYDQASGCLYLDVDLPDTGQLPQRTANVLASGKLRIKDRSRSELRRIYCEMATGLVLFLTAHIFTISPAITEVVVSAYTQRITPSTGKTRDEYIVSARIPRAQLQKINLSQAQPAAVVQAMPEHRLRLLSNGTLREITPL